MAGVKGRSGGPRPNSGRPRLVTEAEVKLELQKMLPDAYKVIRRAVKGRRISIAAHKLRTDNAWRIVDKFVANRKALEVSGDSDRPLGVVVLPELKAKKQEVKAN